MNYYEDISEDSDDDCLIIDEAHHDAPTESSESETREAVVASSIPPPAPPNDIAAAAAETATGGSQPQQSQEIPLEMLKRIPFTADKLILKPKRQIAARKFLPPEAKNEEYYAFRKKNVLSVQKCRKAKEEKERWMVARLQFLEEEVKRLTAVVSDCDNYRQDVQVKMMNLKASVDKLCREYDEDHAKLLKLTKLINEVTNPPK